MVERIGRIDLERNRITTAFGHEFRRHGRFVQMHLPRRTRAFDHADPPSILNSLVWQVRVARILKQRIRADKIGIREDRHAILVRRFVSVVNDVISELVLHVGDRAEEQRIVEATGHRHGQLAFAGFSCGLYLARRGLRRNDLGFLRNGFAKASHHDQAAAFFDFGVSWLDFDFIVREGACRRCILWRKIRNERARRRLPIHQTDRRRQHQAERRKTSASQGRHRFIWNDAPPRIVIRMRDRFLEDRMLQIAERFAVVTFDFVERGDQPLVEFRVVVFDALREPVVVAVFCKTRNGSEEQTDGAGTDQEPTCFGVHPLRSDLHQQHREAHYCEHDADDREASPPLAQTKAVAYGVEFFFE